MIVGGARCGNEAGAKGRCRHHSAVFVITDAAGKVLATATSLRELAKVLQVGQAALVS